MKLSILTAIATAFVASAVAAQTTSRTAQKPSSANQTMIMSGCVTAGSTATDPFTLLSPMIITRGRSTATASGGARDTRGSTGSTETVSGTTGVPPVGAGATGINATGSPTTGTPPVEGTPAASAQTGYRLSGSDLKPYVGKRVQIVGGLVPSPHAAATAGASSSGVMPQTGVSGAINSTTRSASTPGSITLPEFRVTSVKPIEGPCPPR